MLLFINIYGERQRHKIMPTIRSCEGMTLSPTTMTTSGQILNPKSTLAVDFKTGMDVSTNDPDLAKTVLTCEGDLRDPAFPNRLTQIICKLKRLVSDDHKKPFQVTKVEPWNSVRITFNIPRNAAQRLRQLAQRGDNTLRELGILSVQIEGDQVITLTLANNFNESRQQLVVVKSNESVANNVGVVTSSAVNSSININNSELTVNFTNSLTPNSVSVVSNNDLIGSPSIGSSVEITRKNIAQYLSQPHIDVVNTSATSADSINERLPTFLSPNVVAPINTEPIPFLNSNSSTTVTSQLSTCVSTASTSSVSTSAGSRASAVTSAPNSLRDIQSNYGLFPFASMQHSYQAMHTKHYTSVQRLNQVITTPVPLGQTNTLQSASNSTGITSAAATVSSTITSSNRPQPMITRDAKNIKVCPPVSSQSQHSLPTHSSQTQQQSSHQKALSSVAQAVSQSCTVANNQSSASANVALTSPLLVNLLQSDATTGHMKGSSVQTSALNQINVTNDLTQKRKVRKVSRKLKDKSEPEATQPSDSVSITPLLSSAQISLLTTSSTSSSQKHLPSNSLPQQSGIDPQMQTQSTFNISNISPHLISIPLNTMSRFPSIHPEAQGQPQVVRAGQLPLRSQLSRPQISTTKVGSPPIVTQLHKSIFITTSQELSSKPYLTPNPHSKPVIDPKSSPNPNSANNKAVTSGNESNAVFSSPPPSRMTGKTKHLINPFTGLLEPMLSDEEEEDRPSPATLFPELDAGSDVGGNSERSLSDAGSNGKDNNHSSDTDSGLGKSGTDVSSQSSIEVGNGGNTPTHLKEMTSKVIDCKSSSDSITERLKLKVKIEAKNECLKGDTTATTSSLNSPFPSRSHYIKQKSSESSNSLSNTYTTQTDANPLVMAEPRVPPLHISIRGPNSAVVVSNRRESTSELEMKTTVSKKARGVRTTRAMSVESGLGTECTNLNKNQRKKLQREQRFLSGGGIVTSALSVCASPPSVESLVDLNQTLNDSSFTLSLSATTRSSDSMDRLVLQSSDASSKSCAQNKCKDLSNDNKDKRNISLNKSVPLLHNEDNSSQLCAIHVTTDTAIKTRVQSNEQMITNTLNSGSLAVNTSVPTISDTTVNCDSVSTNDSLETKIKENAITTEGSKQLSVSSAPTNQNVESKAQICHINHIAISESTVPSVTSPTDENQTFDELIKSKSRVLPVTTVVTVGPLINANPEPILTKITRIGLNCIPSSIPALVNTRELNFVRNINTSDSTQSTHSTSSRNYLIESTTDIECNETLEANQNSLFDSKSNSNATQIIENSIKTVFSSESKSTDKSEHKIDFILNGEDNSETNFNPINDKIDSETEIQSDSKSLDQQSSDSTEKEVIKSINESKTDEIKEESNSQIECQTDKNDISTEVQSKESTDKRQVVSQIQEITVISNFSKQSVFENTAIPCDSIANESKTTKTTDSVTNAEDSVTKTNDSEIKLQPNTISEVNESLVKNNSNEKRSSEAFASIDTKSPVSDETVKQPLQIVITTTVPSLTTTTTSVFSHLKSSSLESGSRVTLITFKSNLNSPNTSNSSGKTSDSSNSSLSSPLPTKGVPFKLLTIPSGSGGITVRSAANKLVELINSTSSPVSPLSPNQLQSSGSPIPLNTTSPPVRLLVSKMATSGGVGQTGVPVSVAGNSIGQLVVVKSVVMTNPSPSIKLVTARTTKTPTVNTPSLLIPVTQTNATIESLNAINNCEQKPKETSHSVINNAINNSADSVDNNHNSSHQNDSHTTGNDLDNKTAEPVDLTVQCSDSLTIVTSCTEVDDETVPLLIKSSDLTENDMSDEEDNEDNLLTHSVASDHNYNMRKSSDESEITEDSLLNLSNSTETDHLDASKDSESIIDDEFKCNDISDHLSDQQIKQSQDPKTRPNKRKSSENAAELIKACMGVDDAPKKNSTLTYLPPFSVPSGLSARVSNSTRTRTTSLDNESVDTIINDSSESNNLNKTKNLRIRKNKISSTESSLTPENDCSSDEEISIKDNSSISWANKPRLRTGSVTKNQRTNKNNCIKNSNKEKIANRSNERTKRSRERDQNKSSSTQRSTRRSRDHSIVISNAGINLHTSESSSESLHMEIVGLELSNESSANNYNNDPSSASTPSPIITSSLLVKRKTRVGINNNTEQTESSLTKRRRIVKENHR